MHSASPSCSGGRKGVQVRIEVSDDPSDNQTGKREYRVTEGADLPESGEKLIDRAERAMVQLEKATASGALARFLESVAEKQAPAVRDNVGGVVIVHPTLYLVDSEVGRDQIPHLRCKECTRDGLAGRARLLSHHGTAGV